MWHYGFVNLDDPLYVQGNPQVLSGLSWSSLLWAVDGAHAGYWIPVTWISYMLEADLHGPQAAGFHITNLALHVVNVALLFGLLARATGGLWRSAFAAAIFAVHPLHVESVAWITERKDLLSTLFLWLTLWAYGAYVSRPRAVAYTIALVCFALGLMAKPGLVVLPALLLLVDAWPLRRIAMARVQGTRPTVSWKTAVAEKYPFIIVAIVFSALTVLAQRGVQAVVDLHTLPLTGRAMNAVLSYGAYLRDAFLPTGLAVFYPYRRSFSLLTILAVLALLILISVAATAAIRRRPYIFVGWWWFVLSLLPVIGLVQVGEQAMADRFMYIPLAGILVALGWAVPAVVARRPGGRVAVVVAALAIISGYSAAAHAQVRYWADSVTAWQRCVDVTQDNFTAEDSLGVLLAKQGRTTEAIEHLRRAVALDPSSVEGHVNLGTLAASSGDLNQAAREFREATTLAPDVAEGRFGLGQALAALGRTSEAIPELQTAVRLRPSDASFRQALGRALLASQRVADAIAELRRAVELAPSAADIRVDLGLSLAAAGKRDEALHALAEAVRLDPGNADAIAALRVLRAER